MCLQSFFRDTVEFMGLNPTFRPRVKKLSTNNIKESNLVQLFELIDTVCFQW